jgi:hypothetical protein
LKGLLLLHFKKRHYPIGSDDWERWQMFTSIKKGSRHPLGWLGYSRKKSKGSFVIKEKKFVILIASVRKHSACSIKYYVLLAFIKNGVKNIRIDKKTHTLKIYFALCGSPSDLAFVEKIKSPKVLIKNQKTIENPMTHKREIPIFFNI